MTDRQQADFERYMHIVPNKIAKYAPEYIGDEDFEQDCYLHMLEFIQTNETLNAHERQNSRCIRIHRHMDHFIKQKAKQYNNEPALAIIHDEIDPFEYVRKKEIFRNVHSAIDQSLTEQERRIILLRFGFLSNEPIPQADIAQAMGRCRQRVWQIENKAIKKLRSRYSLLCKQTFPIERIIVDKRRKVFRYNAGIRTGYKWEWYKKEITFRTFDYL